MAMHLIYRHFRNNASRTIRRADRVCLLVAVLAIVLGIVANNVFAQTKPTPQATQAAKAAPTPTPTATPAANTATTPSPVTLNEAQARELAVLQMQINQAAAERQAAIERVDKLTAQWELKVAAIRDAALEASGADPRLYEKTIVALNKEGSIIGFAPKKPPEPVASSVTTAPTATPSEASNGKKQ